MDNKTIKITLLNKEKKEFMKQLHEIKECADMVREQLNTIDKELYYLIHNEGGKDETRR